MNTTRLLNSGSYFTRFMAVSALILWGTLTAAGQSIYSGIYFYDADAENGNGYVIGFGVTEESYNSYGHNYYVDTTLYTYSGYSASAFGAGVGDPYTYGRAEAVIRWDTANAGMFFVSTTHTTVCPYYNMEENPSYTYTEHPYEDGGFEEIYYKVDYPKLSPNTCGYDICPHQEHKSCFS